MKQVSQTRKGADRQTTSFSLRKNTQVGNWNVRTMYEMGKAHQVASEMKKYNISILGVSEARWILSGKTKLSTGETILYSGHEDENAQHTEGVAIILSPQANQSLIEWQPEGSRIITASFRTFKKGINLNVIQCYAPTNEQEDEIKNNFYSKLQTVLNRFKDKDLTIVMGDFNAKIGYDNKGYEEIMGRQGLGIKNENGELFINFCADNSLVIGGSIFQHKDIHKATWMSPDHHTHNQIDHICIKKKFRRSLQNVRVFRSADVASDHHLLVGQIRLRLKRQRDCPRRRTQYNVTFLKETNVNNEFRIELRNRFKALEDLEGNDDIGTQWESIKEAWNTTCKQVLGIKTHPNKPWLSDNTLKKIKQRKEKKVVLMNSRTRALKKDAQENYTEANREVKKSIKKDKNDYINNLAAEAETAASKGNIKELYSITKKLAGKFQQQNKPIKDKEGNKLTNAEKQEKRWVEYFKELLNRPAPLNTPDIQPAERDLEIDCNRPTKGEIKNAIKTLKNGKAAGPDGIPAEAIKADIELSTNVLYNIIGNIWEKGELPKDWREGYLVKLPKKGDLTDCSNYRGIMLLSVPGKVLNRIILERIKKAVDGLLRDEQAGFRQNKSCLDQIAALRIIIEQCTEWNASLYINFIDFEKAFDSVDRENLWKLLRHYGIPPKLTDLIKNTYHNMRCRIIHDGKLTEAFEIESGVRQGCLLSPFLFLLVIDWVMKNTTENRKNGIQWTLFKQLEDLDFADDIALLAQSHKQMQEKTAILDSWAQQLGLKINDRKSKIMRINSKSTDAVEVRGKVLEEVDNFTYLGSIVDKEGGSGTDIKVKIQKARGAFAMLKNIWKTKQIRTKTKLRIFNSNVKSVLLYGSESWRLTKGDLNKLQTFVNGCLRRIMDIKWYDKITNATVWERTAHIPVEQEIQKRRWRWIGHTLRKPTTNLTRQALLWNPQGARRRGRPKNTWRREVEKDVQVIGRTWKELEKIARDRRTWKEIVDGLCSTRS